MFKFDILYNVIVQNDLVCKLYKAQVFYPNISSLFCMSILFFLFHSKKRA